MHVQEDHVLDLGEVGRGVYEPKSIRSHHWRRLLAARVPVLATVGLVLLGGGVGGLAIHYWEAEQRRHAAEATLAVMVFVDPVDSVGAIEVEPLAAGGRGRVRVSGSVLLVNNGPLPVDVAHIRADKEAFTLRGSQGHVPARSVASMKVTVTVDCAATRDLGQVPARLQVETADGRRREVTYPLPVARTRWEEQMRLRLFRVALAACGSGLRQASRLRVFQRGIPARIHLPVSRR